MDFAVVLTNINSRKKRNLHSIDLEVLIFIGRNFATYAIIPGEVRRSVFPFYQICKFINCSDQ